MWAVIQTCLQGIRIGRMNPMKLVMSTITKFLFREERIKSFHLINLGHLKNTGILKNTGYERFSGKLNSNFKLFNDKLKIGVNTAFTTSDETLASTDIGSAPTPALAISMAPTIPLFDNNGNYGGPLGAGYSDRNNPVLMQYLNRWDNTERTNIFGNVFAELQYNGQFNL